MCHEKIKEFYNNSINNLDKFDRIILFENLEQDLNKVNQDLKQKKMTENSEKIKKFNKTDEDYLKLYSIENLEEYKKYCIYDIQLYNYVCEKQNMQSFKIN